MKTRNRILLVGLAVVVLVGFAWLVLRPHEPVYKEKPLSFWLQKYDDTGQNLHPDQTGHQEADEAVRSIGPDAVPLLLQRIRADDSCLKFRLLRLVTKQSWVSFRYTPAWALNIEAVMAFEALGVRASNAVPELMKIHGSNISSDSKIAVAFSLGGIGPAASNAIPLLVGYFHGMPEGLLKVRVGNALKKIDAEAAARAGVK